MIPEFKAALFDMDGTLLATMRYWRLTTIEVLLATILFQRRRSWHGCLTHPAAN